MIYQVANWHERYENNRTRELKAMAWVPVPNSHDGDGYTLLVCRDNGAAYLGAWIAILQVASRCDPRGTLLRDGKKPHDAASISRMTRLPEDIIQATLEVCLNECNWLIIKDAQEGAEMPQEGAAISHLAAKNGREGKEGKGAEGKGTEVASLPAASKKLEAHHVDSTAVLEHLNEATGKKFRDTDANLAFISARLKEPGVDLDGVRKMVSRQVALWKNDDKMREYLRPETLFNKTKFDSYYASRETTTAPTASKSASKPHDLVARDFQL
jgi:uncharacterized phage protein (TIGR02220 family)